MPKILFLYLGKRFAYSLLVTLLLVASIVFLFDFIEASKLFSGYKASLLQIIQIAFYRNYYNLNKLLPFIILLAATITFYNLNRRSELIILSTSGLSNIKIVMPAVIIASIFALFVIFLFNPIGAFLFSKSKYIINNDAESDTIIFSSAGIWLRDTDGQQTLNIHAKAIDQENGLHMVNIYFLDENHTFLKRVQSKYAVMEEDIIKLKDATLISKDFTRNEVGNIDIPLNFGAEIIDRNIGVPELIPFWKLPGYISILERIGLNYIEFQLYFYRMLMLPFYFSIMVMLGLIFTSTLPRSKYKETKMVLGLLFGFIVYFLIDLSKIFSISGGLHVVFSSILPISLGVLISVYTLQRVN